jgi:hypothetical protein
VNPNAKPLPGLQAFSAPGNLLSDPSFEDYTPNTYWTETSTNFGTPLCITAGCGSGSYSGPRTGSVWAWFGGVDFTDPTMVSPEAGSLSQSVIIPSDPSGATLQFYLWIGYAEAGSGTDDTFSAKIDGITIFTTDATQIGSYATYTPVNIDLSAYADGGSHEITFESVISGQFVNFNLDDAALCNGACPIAPTSTPTATSSASNNDDFNNAISVSMPYTNTQSIDSATTAGDDPVLVCDGNQGHNSVWYRFTPLSNGVLTVNTAGSDYDTVLAVWTGARGSLVSRGCNDDYNGLQSQVAVNVSTGITYYVEVASYDIGPSGSLNISMSFGVANTPTPTPTRTPTATPVTIPTTIAPSGTIQDTTPTFTWTKIAGATQYQFQLMKGSTSVYVKVVPSSACGATTCSNTPTTALGLFTYTWKVQAMTGGVWKTYSPDRTFTITAIPVPLSPSGTIVDTTPTYTWTKIAGATQYRFQLMKGTTSVYIKAVASSACGATTCTNTPTTALGHFTYQWKVQVMVGGVWKPYSAYKTFTIGTVGAPKPGFWSGGGVSFYVTPNQASVKNFTMSYSVPECGLTGTVTHTSPLPPITNKNFSFTGSFYGSGSFNTTASAHGTAGLNNYYIYNCGYITRSISWTATWQNSNQP